MITAITQYSCCRVSQTLLPNTHQRHISIAQLDAEMESKRRERNASDKQRRLQLQAIESALVAGGLVDKGPTSELHGVVGELHYDSHLLVRQAV